MTWILTTTGREHDLAHPPTSGYPLREIAHALSHINRYTGHTARPYSVAEHSLLVADMAHAEGCTTELELCALMHDAHEAYVGDVPSPLKPLLGSAWEVLEQAAQYSLLASFDLVEAMALHAAEVKRFDLMALATERRDLLPFEPSVHKPWPVLDTPGKEVTPWNGAALMLPSYIIRRPDEWAWRFEKRAQYLMDCLARARAVDLAEAA